MRYLALACDYDGTLATNGRVDAETVAALERLLATGRKLLLVTGRELPELLEIFPQVTLFERVVAENGALLYHPQTREEKVLGAPPSAQFVSALRERGVTRLSVGRSIVATWEPYEQTVLGAIRDLGLELHVIFNKGAVMVLPAGVNKASGMAAALEELELSPHETVGVGDAENDHAFLSSCECGVAVGNALPAVKDRADLVTNATHGMGVAELIDKLIENDLSEMKGRLARHHLQLGTAANGQALALSPNGPNMLIAGPSGSGKSTVAASFLERLHDKKYQFCIVDPEGDYANLAIAVTLGDNRRGPTCEEVLQVLRTPGRNAVVNLIGLALADRPPFFVSLLSRLQDLRTRTARPHWLIVDEAHHLLPTSWEPGSLAIPHNLQRTLLITVHPGQVSAAVIATVGIVAAVGASPEQTLQEFCEVVQETLPEVEPVELETGEVLFWQRQNAQDPYVVRVAPSRLERRRHTRKYAEGELPPERSFYFRGPQGKLNLRAQNLLVFLQLADGVDEETWNHHLQQGDYSTWFRERIKDDLLADEARTVETQAAVSPAESRRQIRELIERYYTLPAAVPFPMPGTDADPSA